MGDIINPLPFGLSDILSCQNKSLALKIFVTLLPCLPFDALVYNYCADNGGCSHLCLPRLGGLSCRCPDTTDGQCEERVL